MDETSRGFLIYAHNNEEIDYGKLALCCALMIKSNLKVNSTCLVTDAGTLSYLKNNTEGSLFDQAFDHVVVTDWSFKDSATTRNFLDTHSTSKNLTWFNGSRSSAYDVSPFDETIVLDSDVLVQDNMFDLVWGNDEDVLINREAVTLLHTPPKPNERRLEGSSITMFWATMIYFRKSEKAKTLFDLVSHIKSKYYYYQHIYEFPGKLYRNDYAFSIAIHMMSGFMQNDEFKSFPSSKILSSFDTDELLSVDKGELRFLASVNNNHWEFEATTVKGITTHVMNKYSLLRCADDLIEIYR